MLLHEMTKKPIKEQVTMLDEAYTSWVGDSYEQIDDILVIGVSLSS